MKKKIWDFDCYVSLLIKFNIMSLGYQRFEILIVEKQNIVEFDWINE